MMVVNRMSPVNHCLSLLSQNPSFPNEIHFLSSCHFVSCHTGCRCLDLSHLNSHPRNNDRPNNRLRTRCRNSGYPSCYYPSFRLGTQSRQTAHAIRYKKLSIPQLPNHNFFASNRPHEYRMAAPILGRSGHDKRPRLQRQAKTRGGFIKFKIK